MKSTRELLQLSNINPGCDFVDPRSRLRVRATRSSLNILPTPHLQKKGYGIRIEVDRGWIIANIKTRDRKGNSVLPAVARDILQFAIQYFDTNAFEKPIGFVAGWMKRHSVNLTQYNDAMRGRKDTEPNRLKAAGKTWTAGALGEDFEPEYVKTWRDKSMVEVVFRRKK